MTSDSDHWQELQTLFDLADAAAPDDRERILADACTDAALRERVIALLRAAEEVPVASPSKRQTIGPYTILNLIGSGGVGTVYLAERTLGSAVQRVALKVLAPHAAGPHFVDRFAREQQILAGLDHPNITRLLDAGLSENGQPYLVMEFVEGLRLDAYCESRTLDIPARLVLFRRICDVVDYAHRNLVVHLDLKPSNIMVTSDGTVKLLDFGTAKLSQANGTFTATVMATPAYASPEQLRHEPVTTASDVYSLGVILSELVTGRRTPTERSAASGDLPTIVSKCRSEAPLERYASVNALSEEIARYLEGRPILARPQTTLYQLTKFVRRNRGKVGLTLLLAIGLGGSVVYAWMEQQKALREAQRAARMQNFMSRLFDTADPGVVGRPEPTVKQFLETGAQVLPKYLQDPVDLRHGQLSLASSLYANHDYAPARRLCEQALASATNAGDPATAAEALATLGQIEYAEGHNDEAKAKLERAVAMASGAGISPEARFFVVRKYTLIGGDLGLSVPELKAMLTPALEQVRNRDVPPTDLADALYLLAGCDLNQANLESAEKEYLDAIRFYQRDPLARCYEFQTMTGLADLRRDQNRPREAAELLQQAYGPSLECWGNTPYTQNHEARLADSLILSGDVTTGLSMLEKAESKWMQPPVNKSIVYQNLRYLANGYVAAGRFADALRVLEQAHELFGKELPEANLRRAPQELLRARALAGLGRFGEALPFAESAARAYKSIPMTPLRRGYADAAHSLVEQIRRSPR